MDPLATNGIAMLVAFGMPKMIVCVTFEQDVVFSANQRYGYNFFYVD
jgi:hypothetical protein